MNYQMIMNFNVQIFLMIKNRKNMIDILKGHSYHNWFDIPEDENSDAKTLEDDE